MQYEKVGLRLQRLERPLSRLPRTTAGPRLRDVRLVAVIRRGHVVTGHVVDECVMNVVARDVVDCLEVFVPLRGALSTVEPATRVHAVTGDYVHDPFTGHVV